MLRPASLPPREGLSSSRFGPRGLPRCRRPATRRSDAYRDGTCTRWRSAARLVDPQEGFVFAVTAHHGGSIPVGSDIAAPRHALNQKATGPPKFRQNRTAAYRCARTWSPTPAIAELVDADKLGHAGADAGELGRDRRCGFKADSGCGTRAPNRASGERRSRLRDPSSNGAGVHGLQLDALIAESLEEERAVERATELALGVADVERTAFAGAAYDE